MDASYISISKNIVSILNNSIVVNETKPRDNTNGGFVLLGIAETEDSYSIIRSVVNKKRGTLKNITNYMLSRRIKQKKKMLA